MSPSRPRSERRTDPPVYVALEPRALLAAITYDVATKVVSVTGTEGADWSRVLSPVAGQVEVQFSGIEVQTFAQADVSRIVFSARGGDDWFRNDTVLPSIFYGQGGNDTAIGGAGIDRFRGGPGADNLVGGDGDDFLNGDTENDSLDGGHGNDAIEGWTGDDSIQGGTGDDRITAGTGNDTVYAGNGNDQVYGHDGNDLIFGGFGADTLAGQGGDDLVYGEGGEDSLFGNDGKDELYGGLARDRLVGGNQDDQLFGGDGIDTLLGGAGDDKLAGGANLGYLYGEAGNDTIYGGDQNDWIRGGDGDDRLFGQGGFDQLFGDADRDILLGGDSKDRLEGGTGDDDFYSDIDDEVVEDDEDDPGELDEPYLKSSFLPNRITVSFVPDGTPGLGNTSRLFTAFSSLLSGQAIQAAFINSLKMWTAHGNLDVGLVPDSGAPLGVAGPVVGDPRFGDIRISALPLAGDVYAVAMGQAEAVSGTWAGDIVFNSNALFDSPEHFFAVALHEVGHALGLKHTRALDSVMHRFSRLTALSAGDIATFQDLYGLRRLDGNDLDSSQNNDSRERATLIRLDDHGVEPGTWPGVNFGDLHATSDLDFFRFDVPDGYAGQVRFQIDSRQLSFVAPTLSLLNEAGEVLQTVTADDLTGDLISLTVTPTVERQRFYLRVDGLSNASLGRYALVTRLLAREAVDEPALLRVVREPAFETLDESDLAEFFADPEGYLFGPEDGADDTFPGAVVLETDDGYEAFARMTYRGSLATPADVDLYQFQAAEFEASATPVLNLSARSLQVPGMAPKLRVFDAAQQPVAAEIIVNGQGEIAVQIPGFSSGASYFLEVTADSLLPFASGSYELTISYSFEPLQLTTRSAGEISSTTPQYHTIHVAESQLMQFALELAPAAAPPDALVWATVFNAAGEVVYQGASRPGERRTRAAVYLAPGTYRIEVRTTASSLQGVAYQVIGVSIGDRQGPTFSDSSSSPFERQPDGRYAYPGNVLTSATYVFADGAPPNQPPPPPPPPPPGNLYAWYWYI
ncbi:MAG: matrixin family metalloprotease [Planctomycetota bacterium]